MAWVWPLLALALSAVLTLATTRYANRRLLDLPGRRRSHEKPTPRGGGLGFVIAILACAVAPLALARAQEFVPVAVALAAVAAIGFVDDHRALSAPVRLLVQLIAVALALYGLAPGFGLAPGSLPAWLALAACALALLWSINLHNFMDGIDGLLALQAIFVGLLVAFAADRTGAAELRDFALVGVGAVAGFVPFNFPRARVFMGDVGSGMLGLWIGVLLLLAIGAGRDGDAARALPLPGALAAVSAFVVDASLTLASRMLRGRRWYSAHREHLYQWLVRSGSPHGRVAGWYMLWNLLIVVPATLATLRLAPVAAWVVTAMVYFIGSILWWRARAHCLDLRRDGRHAVGA
jgi:UDP-N-acetylmuramyl pentapeptide phosphotransferase/UDP-N-acetylglucosamine-1-phosphate transferase